MIRTDEQTPQQMMLDTLTALSFGVIAMFIIFGYGFAFNLVLACSAAVATEAILLKLRKIPPRHFISDMSALLTGVLIALSLPPYLPWWIPVLASISAIALGKQIYGGLGNNIFNPAMLGYCIVLVAYPLHLTAWPDADTLAARFDLTSQYINTHSGEVLSAAMTGATPLESWREGLAVTTTSTPIAWWLINLAFAGGGIWLLLKRVIRWHIPVAMIAGLSLTIYASSADVDLVRLHLLSGATMLGAFFIATDPVTSPRTPYAMLVFGGAIGCLLAIIRSWGSYADGLAFAVLLMNATVPLLNKVLPR